MKSLKLKEKINGGTFIFLRRRFLLFTFPFLLLTMPLLVKAEEVTTTNRLQQFLDGLQTFTAGFEQTLFNEFGQPLEVSSGNVSLGQPGKFYWAYEQPYTQLLISNGTSLWIYDEDLAQVTISNIGDAVEKSPASILSGDVDLEQSYNISDLGAAGDSDWIELDSKDINSQYDAIRLGFREQELTGMVIFDNLGQHTLIVFSDPVRNAELQPALFEFEPPAGVDVIDSRE